MDGLASTECAAQSVGAANQLIGLLIQTFLTAQCSISPPDFWPDDYGEKLLSSAGLWPVEKSKFLIFSKFLTCFVTDCPTKVQSNLILIFRFVLITQFHHKIHQNKAFQSFY